MSRNRSRVISRLPACLAFVLLLLSTGRSAQAYVDPGSGALVWQSLLAALVGSLFYFRRIFGWIKTRLFKSRED